MSLREQLVTAENEVEALKRRIAAENCREVGCDMKHIGGRNAGCDDACVCSIPVYECTKCGDSDYGDNAEARDKIDQCERYRS